MADQAAPPRERRSRSPALQNSGFVDVVELLRNYCQQGRKPAKLTDPLATARESTREVNDRPLPQHNALHRSVVELLIEDYEAGASTHELAKRYNVRRNTVRDTLRRAGFDPADKGKRAAFSDEQRPRLGVCLPTVRPVAS